MKHNHATSVKRAVMYFAALIVSSTCNAFIGSGGMLYVEPMDWNLMEYHEIHPNNTHQDRGPILYTNFWTNKYGSLCQRFIPIDLGAKTEQELDNDAFRRKMFDTALVLDPCKPNFDIAAYEDQEDARLIVEYQPRAAYNEIQLAYELSFKARFKNNGEIPASCLATIEQISFGRISVDQNNVSPVSGTVARVNCDRSVSVKIKVNNGMVYTDTESGVKLLFDYQPVQQCKECEIPITATMASFPSIGTHRWSVPVTVNYD
ncbi:hypothetical protein [Vibrio cholerae]|uniref:hypothetical protein n=1 Tax=Vibrio cholerae TaxID=666 RepID=UPI000BA948CE|nr:hypothetical protein [Vibrio cholerae]